MTNYSPLPNPVVGENGVLSKETTVNGITFPAGSTPEQRQALILKAGTVTQFQTDANVTRFAQGEQEQRGKAPPPSTTSREPPAPAELEASRRMPSGDPVADFDAEMRARGLQTTEPPPAAHQPRDAQGRFLGDSPAVEAVTAWYRGLKPEEREAKRGEYEARLRAVMEGASPAPAHQADDRGPDDPYWDQAWNTYKLDGSVELTKVGQELDAKIRAEYRELSPEEQSNPDVIDEINFAILRIRETSSGNVPVNVFHPDMLHGYTLPKLIPDQHYPPQIIHQLAAARKAGVTQEQVDNYIREDMRSRGYSV